MTISATVELTESEQELLEVARKLPPARQSQLLDFANFLAFQTQGAQDANGWDEEGATFSATTQDDDEKWERLLARPEAQERLHKLGQEALEEHKAGRTLDIVATEDGRLAPSRRRKRPPSSGNTMNAFQLRSSAALARHIKYGRRIQTIRVRALSVWPRRPQSIPLA